jgi:hypothetical protein
MNRWRPIVILILGICSFCIAVFAQARCVVVIFDTFANHFPALESKVLVLVAVSRLKDQSFYSNLFRNLERIPAIYNT